MNPVTRFLLAAIASGATVTYAQTFSSCNPTLKSGCPADTALGKAVEYDFTAGAPEDFTVSTGAAPTFTKNGGEFTIKAHGDSPTMSSKWYMMFGHYDIQVKVSPGQGIVSSLVMQSDDLDEIDWEWLGGASEEVQTNYFGQGKTTTYTRNQTLPNAGSQSDFHTYSLDWTADQVQWSIDGKAIRTLTPETAVTGQYPQSPMQLKIGSWAAGDSSQPQGTIAWAGGETDYTKGPFTMYVKSVKAIDYSTGKSYSYGDQTGTWQSIKSDGGQVNSKGDPNAAVSTATASGTAVSQTGAASVASVAGSNSTTNGTGSAGSASPSGSAASGQSTLQTSATAAAPFPTGKSNSTGTASASASAGASTTASTGHNAGSSGSPQSGAAGRTSIAAGAMVLAAAVMVL